MRCNANSNSNADVIANVNANGSMYSYWQMLTCVTCVESVGLCDLNVTRSSHARHKTHTLCVVGEQPKQVEPTFVVIDLFM